MIRISIGDYMTSDPSDKRMYFLRNKEIIENNPDTERDLLEYEVFSDSYIVGKFEYGCYTFMPWEISYPGKYKKLCFRVEQTNYFDWKDATGKTYYHGGGIIEELTALTSVFFRARFNVGHIVRWNDKPVYWNDNPIYWNDKTTDLTDLMGRGKIDKKLLHGRVNLSELKQWFKSIENLNPELHQRFIWAVRLYNRAISIIEEEPDMAYLNLVSCIEALCQDIDIEKNIKDLNDDKLVRLLKSIDNEELKKELENHLLKREKMIRKKFVEFIIEHIESDFWKESEDKSIRIVKPGEIRDLLNKIYIQRSNTLHNGEAFPKWLLSSPREEILSALDVTSAGRKWDKKDYIPYPCFFEGLVNHVLKTFVKRNQM